MEYGLTSYKNCTLEPEDTGLCTYIENGFISGYPGSKSVKIPVRTEGEPANILLCHDEMPDRQITLERSLDAPSKKAKHLDISNTALTDSGGPVPSDGRLQRPETHI